MKSLELQSALLMRAAWATEITRKSELSWLHPRPAEKQQPATKSRTRALQSLCNYSSVTFSSRSCLNAAWHWAPQHQGAQGGTLQELSSEAANMIYFTTDISFPT